jgi:drug/metabolite transporter (DMT)-like permease
MSHNQLGQCYALLTAIIWAFALVLFKLSGDTVRPLALNLYKNTIGLALLGITLAGLTLGGDGGTVAAFQQPWTDWGKLAISGILGIAIADTLFFRALNLIGVGLVAVADCVYSPMAILFAWLLLGEQLSWVQYIGAGLVISGVFAATQHELPPNRTRLQIIGGMLMAMFAISLMAFAIVWVKPVLQQFPLFWATTVRMTAGTLLLAVFGLRGRDWRRNWEVFRPSPVWRVALPGSVLGAYFSMVLWVAGYKDTLVGLAALLNQTSIFFASILAVIVLKEHFDVRKIAALLLGATGVAVVTFSARLQEWWLRLVALLA